MDFLISDVGDLLFEPVQKKKKLRLLFNKSSNESLRISFKTPDYFDGIGESAPRNSLKISFDTNHKERSYKTETKDNADLDKQRIIIALRTELGEIKDRRWLGSELQSKKHLYIREQKFLKAIEKDIKKAIEHILPKAHIVAEREYVYNYHGHNNVSVSVYNNNLLIFQFYL